MRYSDYFHGESVLHSDLQRSSQRFAQKLEKTAQYQRRSQKRRIRLGRVIMGGGKTSGNTGSDENGY